jgi:hypothetical protein
MGLGTGQDLGVGGSHLCRIAEVQPNDPGPRARRANPSGAGSRAGVSAEKSRGFSGEEKDAGGPLRSTAPVSRSWNARYP